jgi:HSP20 family molecular chaperone IbpA
MQTQLWNPWLMFDELERTVHAARSPEWPVFDLVQSDTTVTLSADLFGMTEDEIELRLEGRCLILRGIHPHFRAPFERQYQLPDRCDPSEVDAHVTNGILTVTLTT